MINEIYIIIKKIKIRIKKNVSSRYIYLTKTEANFLIEFFENQNNEIENIKVKNEVLLTTISTLRREYDIIKENQNEFK